MLHRSCSHVLKKKHASGATDKLPVLTESTRTHVDACMHEKETVRKLKKHLRKKKQADLVTSLTSPLEMIPWQDLE